MVIVKIIITFAKEYELDKIINVFDQLKQE